MSFSSFGHPLYPDVRLTQTIHVNRNKNRTEGSYPPPSANYLHCSILGQFQSKIQCGCSTMTADTPRTEPGTLCETQLRSGTQTATPCTLEDRQLQNDQDQQEVRNLTCGPKPITWFVPALAHLTMYLEPFVQVNQWDQLLSVMDTSY